MGIKRVPTYFNDLPVSAVRVKITAVSAGRLILMMKVLKFITRSAVSLAIGYAVI